MEGSNDYIIDNNVTRVVILDVRITSVWHCYLIVQIHSWDCGLVLTRHGIHNGLERKGI